VVVLTVFAPRRVIRTTVIAALALISAELTGLVLRELGLGWFPTVLGSVAFGGVGAALTARKITPPVQALPRWAAIAFVALSLLATVQTARQTLFMIDGRAQQHAVLPSDNFSVHHNCFTAYYQAARHASEVPNIYIYASATRDIARGDANEAWRVPTDKRPAIDDWFLIDKYEYPPAFLVLVRPLVALGVDFATGRALWFVFEVSVLLFSFVVVAAHLGRENGWRFVLVSPLIYLGASTQIALQWGNFQPTMIALSLVAMVALWRGRETIGAVLLALVILTKLYPGILLVVLAARAQWRAVLLTIAAMVGWIGLGMVVLGVAPFKAFLAYQMPRMASGEAFGMLRTPFIQMGNHGVYAIPLKLRFLGVLDASAKTGAAVAWVYTLVPVAVAVVLGRRIGRQSADGDRHAFLAAAAISVVLASLRSPFLPQDYAACGAVWLVALLAASPHCRRSREQTGVLFALAVLVQVFAPWQVFSSHPSGPFVAGALALIAQIALVTTVVMLIRHVLRPSGALP
jgi:alpha-1,2-mannosyltransferase